MEARRDSVGALPRTAVGTAAERKRSFAWPTLYVIDVAGGEKIPRMGGPGITKRDLLVINKTDLAPHVGSRLAVMEADTRRMLPDHAGERARRLYVMTDLRRGRGLVDVVRFIETRGRWFVDQFLICPIRNRRAPDVVQCPARSDLTSSCCIFRWVVLRALGQTSPTARGPSPQPPFISQAAESPDPASLGNIAVDQ